MILFENENFKCEFDNQVPCITVTYLGPQSSKDLIADVNQATVFFKEKIKEYPTLAWLSNNKEQETINPEVIEWANSEWLPGMMKVGLKKMALIVPEDLFAQVSLEDFTDTAREYYNEITLKSRYFTDIEVAKQWLRSI